MKCKKPRNSAGLFRQFRDSGLGGYIALHLVGTIAEEMLFNLLGQVFAMLGINQIQTILIDDHRLHFDPLLPGFLGHAFENARTECARIRRMIQTFGLVSELDAIAGAHAARQGPGMGKHRLPEQSP